MSTAGASFKTGPLAGKRTQTLVFQSQHLYQDLVGKFCLKTFAPTKCKKNYYKKTRDRKTALETLASLHTTWR